MMAEGLILMVAGMGTVVTFLVLMVLVMQATGVFFKRFAHVFEEPEPAPRAKQPAADGLEAIAVAVAAVAARR